MDPLKLKRQLKAIITAVGILAFAVFLVLSYRERTGGPVSPELVRLRTVSFLVAFLCAAAVAPKRKK